MIQRRRPLARRKRPGFFIVERPRQLWQLDMTSIWVAEHGWTYLNAIIDCCTREIVGWEPWTTSPTANAPRRLGSSSVSAASKAVRIRSRISRAPRSDFKSDGPTRGGRQWSGESGSTPTILQV